MSVEKDITLNEFEDLTGKMFNELEVLYEDESSHRQGTRWVCLCHNCGNKVIRTASKLKQLRYKTCGCGRPIRDRQGQSKDKLYMIWNGMKFRCYNKKSIDYYRYGGRGITICDEWLDDYNIFKEWALLNGYKEGLSLERIDFNLNYCPENCKWIPTNEQAKNTSRNVFITVNNETHIETEWAKIFNYNYFPRTSSLIKRIKREFGQDILIHIRKGDIEYDV